MLSPIAASDRISDRISTRACRRIRLATNGTTMKAIASSASDDQAVLGIGKIAWSAA